MKSSLILLDSIPLPNEKQLYQLNPVSVVGVIVTDFIKPCKLGSTVMDAIVAVV